MNTIDRNRLNEKEWLLLGLVILLFLYSILRGIRFPNLWAASHFYFSYDPVFIKRGFLGTVIGWINWDVLYTYSFFCYFSLVLFTANMGLLLDSTLKLVKSDDLLVKAAALIYSTSFSLVFLAHTMGYADHIQLLAAQLLIRIRSFRSKVMVALPTVVILLLIHESFLLTFFPVVILSLVVGHEDVDTSVKLKAAGSLFFLMLAVTWTVNRQLISETGMVEMLRILQGRVDFPVRADALGALYRSTADNMSIMRSIWQDPNFLKHQALSLLLTFPSVLYFLYVAIRRMQLRERPWIWLVIVFASLAPFSLHMFGWDVHRWNTIVVASSYLSLVVISPSRFFHGDSTSAGRGTVLAAGLAALILIMNCSQKIPLYDYREVAEFPFRSHIEYLSEVVRGEAPFPRIPDI